MKNFIPTHTPFRKLLCLALLCFGAALVQAQAEDEGKTFPEKLRGPVVSVDSENKTLTIDWKKGGGVNAVPFDESSTVKSSAGVRSFDALKPGMFVILYMKEDGKTIKNVRHVPEEDNVTD